MNINNSKQAIQEIAIKLEHVLDDISWFNSVVEVSTSDEEQMATSLQIQYATLKVKEAHSHFSRVLDYLEKTVPFPPQPKYWLFVEGEPVEVSESEFTEKLGADDGDDKPA